MDTKKIIIGSDHAGFGHKAVLIDHLKALGFEVEDKGTYSADSIDYPDYAHPVAAAVDSGEYTRGVVLCGSGNGVCMTANKHQNVRAALCWTEELAELGRLHNDANILCVPARFVSEETAIKMLDAFLNTDFEGGRHTNRRDKIAIK